MMPVFSTRELEANVERFIEVAKLFKCKVHLYYISPRHSFSIFSKAGWLHARQKISHILNEHKTVENYMSQLLHICPSIKFYSISENENVESSIIDYCDRNKIEMILFLGHWDSGWGEMYGKLNISGLSEILDCPVMSINFKTQSLDIKNIVIPIGASLPTNQIIAGCYIGKRFNSKVHLVALNKKFLVNGRSEAINLYRAYHFLHDNTSLPVECITLMSKNIDEATFQYAEQISADVVFVDSGRGAGYAGMMN